MSDSVKLACSLRVTAVVLIGGHAFVYGIGRAQLSLGTWAASIEDEPSKHAEA
jgi:hypothetical protein